MNKLPINRRACALSFTSVCLMLTLTACGGGMPEDDATLYAGGGSVQTTDPANADTYSGAAAQLSAKGHGSSNMNSAAQPTTQGQSSSNTNSAAHAASKHQGAFSKNSATQRSPTTSRMDTASFTVNPSSDFKGFNHQVWNDKRSWYECDCGNQPQRQPNKMPWNTTG